MRRALLAVAMLVVLGAAFASARLADDDCNPLTAADVPALAIPDRALGGVERACARAVVRDWYSDGVVDRSFGLRCYGSALATLPPGGFDHSTVRDDIEAAYVKRYLELHSC